MIDSNALINHKMIEVTEKSLKGYSFIDLFAGIGGFHYALSSYGAECLYASEWDKPAQETYFSNFGMMPSGDITKIAAEEIPSHDILCGGFPCQAFSVSGKRLGFEDTRGTLFFDIARIVKLLKNRCFNVLLIGIKKAHRTQLKASKLKECFRYYHQQCNKRINYALLR